MATKKQRLILGAAILVALFGLLELHSRASSAVNRTSDQPGTLAVALSQDRTAGTPLSKCIVQSISEYLQLDFTHIPYLTVTADDLTTEYVRRPRARKRTMMLVTARRLYETCFKLDSFHILRPCTEDPMCPCEETNSECLSIGNPRHCSSRLPLMLDTRVVQFIRNPIDLVLASYTTLVKRHSANQVNKHGKKNKPSKKNKPGLKFGAGRTLLAAAEGGLEFEAIDNLDLEEFEQRMLAYGADKRLLEKLNIGTVPSDTPYRKYLQSLPSSEGVQLEFLRLAPSLFAEGRQFLRNNRSDTTAMRVRVEDFENYFDETLRELIRFTNVAQYTDDIDGLVSAVTSNCDVSGGDFSSLDLWQQSVAQRKRNKQSKEQTHLGNVLKKQGHEALSMMTEALLSEPVIRESLCGLSHVFGYADHRCFRQAESEQTTVKTANVTAEEDSEGEPEEKKQSGFSLDFSSKGGSLFKAKNELSDIGVPKRRKKKKVKEFNRLLDLGQIRPGDVRKTSVGEENPFDD